MKINYDLCYGCTACEKVCPTDAIKMIQDEKGFWIPKIDEELCIECMKCKNVCPYENKYSLNKMLSAYAFIHNDKKVLEESSSGGMFTAIADMILLQDGVIYGAVLNERMVVEHRRSFDKTGYEQMRGSKYVQSYLGKTYESIKKDLLDEKWVLFTGTPCQVDGLKHFLNNINQEKLLTCDLICNGVPSPLIWKEHLNLLKRKYSKKIIEYKFRSKKWGWKVHKEFIKLETGKEIHSTALIELFKNLYYSRLVMRNSCYTCPYTSVERIGDLTIADCRNIEKIYPNMDTFNGVSLVMINTEKGKKIFNIIKDKGKYYPIEINKIIQPPLIKAGKKPIKSDEFWDNYLDYNYEYAIKKYYGRFFELKYFLKKILGKI